MIGARPSSRPDRVERPPIDTVATRIEIRCWCNQCQRRVRLDVAKACRSPFCKAK
jgi:hypothetical protein